MKKAIIAKKIGMTQVFTEDAKFIPVTVLEAGPCPVIQVKTIEKEGYDAVRVGFMDAKERLVTKPAKGQFAKLNIIPKKYIKELKFEDCSSYSVGDEIKADIFAKGDKVDCQGVSKGKGYQGVIKKNNFGRGPMSHGSKYHRARGAGMAGTSPGKVRKGRKMASHMGHVLRTIQNLEIVRADAEKNLILVKGSVPGAKGTIIVIKEAVKS